MRNLSLAARASAAVRRWRNGACSAGLRGGGGAMRHHYPVAMQWLMAFEAANPVMLYLLGW